MTGKLYVFIGADSHGKRLYANRGCSHCGGRGSIGVNTTTGQFLGCRCLNTCDLPINWVILPRRAA